MCRTVSDAAAILQVISGPDERDPWSMTQPPIPDYLSALNLNFIKGNVLVCSVDFIWNLQIGRVGRIERQFSRHTAWQLLRRLWSICGTLEPKWFALLKSIRQEPFGIKGRKSSEYCRPSSRYDIALDWYHLSYSLWKIGINEYLSQLSEHRTEVYNLADIIHFNRTHPEMHFKGEEMQDL
jgi:hypothetical protein